MHSRLVIWHDVDNIMGFRGVFWREGTILCRNGSNGNIELLKFFALKDVLGIFGHVLMPPNMVTSSVWNTHENGCPWDEQTCWSAAKYGHIECLKYAHEKGCPWDEKTCWSAAYYGHLECLTYAHENGCPWDEKTCSCAALGGQLECWNTAWKQMSSGWNDLF